MLSNTVKATGWRRFGRVLRNSAHSWLHHRAASKGAAVAFYTMFSMAPVLVLVTAIAGAFFGPRAAQGEIVGQLRGLVASNGNPADFLPTSGWRSASLPSARAPETAHGQAGAAPSGRLDARVPTGARAPDDRAPCGQRHLPAVSGRERRTCRRRHGPRRLVLEDLGSTNGTTVNGIAITKHFLRDHDTIDIGRHTLVYLSGEFTMPEQASMPEATGTVAVTENGGATIGDDEATVVPRTRERTGIDMSTSPGEYAASTGATDREPEIRAQRAARMAVDPVAHNDAPDDAPTLEVLDGPSAGLVVNIGREEFVLGRLGVQIAAVRRTSEGFRLVRVEGETSPRVNGAALPPEGALLSIGDEIEVAGTRVLCRPPL